MQFSQRYFKHPFPRCFTVKEDEGRTLWLDTQSHASSSASSADDDYSWQWPTSFWSQFKVSTNVCSNCRIQCYSTRLSIPYLRGWRTVLFFFFFNKRQETTNTLLLVLYIVSNRHQYKNILMWRDDRVEKLYFYEKKINDIIFSIYVLKLHSSGSFDLELFVKLICVILETAHFYISSFNIWKLA